MYLRAVQSAVREASTEAASTGAGAGSGPGDPRGGLPSEPHEAGQHSHQVHCVSADTPCRRFSICLQQDRCGAVGRPLAAQTAAKRCGRRPAAAASSAAVARQASSAVRASPDARGCLVFLPPAFADSSDNKASPQHNQTCSCKKSKKPPPPPTPCFTENNTVFPCVAPCFCQDRWNSSQINSTDHIRYSSVYNLSLRESFPGPLLLCTRWQCGCSEPERPMHMPLQICGSPRRRTPASSDPPLSASTAADSRPAIAILTPSSRPGRESSRSAGS